MRPLKHYPLKALASTPKPLSCASSIEEGWRQKQRQKSLRLFWGQNLFNSLPRQLFYLGRYGRKGYIHPFFKSTETKQLAQQGSEKMLPTNQTRRPLSLLLSPSFFFVFSLCYEKPCSVHTQLRSSTKSPFQRMHLLNRLQNCNPKTYISCIFRQHTVLYVKIVHACHSK